MEAKFWHNCWSERDIGFHQSEINAYLMKYWPSLQLPEQSTVLVPLCGKSRDMVWLAQQGFSVIGLELSEVAVGEFFEELEVKPEIERSDRFVIYTAGNIRILCGDFFAVTAQDLGQVNAVYDRAALVALPPKMRERYAEHMTQLVSDQAKTLLITFEYDAGQAKGPPFCVDRAEVARLFGGRLLGKSGEVELLDDQPFDLRGAQARELAFRVQYR